MLLSHSASGMDALKIEEMEKLLKEAHLERARLLESKVIENLGSVYLTISYNIVTKDPCFKLLNSCGSSASCVYCRSERARHVNSC